MKLNRIAIGGAAGIMGLGLIGVGAHAAFTTTTQSHQQVTAGTLKVVFSTNSAIGATGTGTTTLALKDVGPTNSSFVTSTKVTVKNVGTVVANNLRLAVTATVGAPANSANLESQMWACLSAGTAGNTHIVFNEPLSTAMGYGTITVGGTIQLAATETYTLTLYAGSTDAGCGTAFTGVSGHAWTTSSHLRGTTATKNTAAISLNNTAEGGVVTPKVTVNYGA